MAEFSISPSEIKAGKLPEKINIFRLIDKLRLPLTSNRRSKIDVSLTPYIIEPLNAVGRHDVDEIYVVAPTQSGKTVILQTAFADHVYQGRGNAYYCLPDKISGEKQVQEKLISIIKASDVLHKYTRKPWSKTLTNSILHLVNKKILLAWSNSPASMNSIPAPIALLDEVRLFKKELGNESNAIKLLADRLTTYEEAGQLIGVSTPSHEGDLLHGQISVRGTQELWFMSKCPTCGKWQPLDFFKNVLNFYPNASTTNPKAHCRFCRNIWPLGREKRNLVSGYATKDYEGATSIPPVKMTRRMVFRYSSMVSPFRSIAKIHEQYFNTKDSIPDYKNFIQAWCAKFWRLSESKISRADITITDRPKGEVPVGTRLITAGGDTQDDGFYFVVVAWDKGMKATVIDNFFLSSDMHTTTEEEVETLLRENVEEAVYTDKHDSDWEVAYWGIDTKGHRTSQIVPALNRLSKCIPFAGRNSQRENIEVSANENLWFIISDTYAEETEKRMTNIKFHSAVDEDFIRQVLNYQKMRDRADKRGFSKIIWKKLGQNDYRMALIYAFAVMDIDIGGQTYRVRLNKKDFLYNPLSIKRSHSNKVKEPEESRDRKTDTEYFVKNYSQASGQDFIGGFDSGWL